MMLPLPNREQSAPDISWGIGGICQGADMMGRVTQGGGIIILGRLMLMYIGTGATGAAAKDTASEGRSRLTRLGEGYSRSESSKHDSSDPTLNESSVGDRGDDGTSSHCCWGGWKCC